MKLSELVRRSQLSDADAKRFHELRLIAIKSAMETFEDRAASYNVNHEPYHEMPFGIVSLVSELFKRVIRLTSLVSPARQDELRQEDIARILDTMIDSINYASWGYAMTVIAMNTISKEEEVWSQKNTDKTSS